MLFEKQQLISDDFEVNEGRIFFGVSLRKHKASNLTLLLILEASVPVPLDRRDRFPPQQAEYHMVGKQKGATQPSCGSHTMLWPTYHSGCEHICVDAQDV